MIIDKEILDRIDIVKDEKITENIGIAYDFLSQEIPVCLRKNVNRRHNSYHIKRKIERITDKYISNLDLKYCMESLGVKKYYDDPFGEFYCYPISERWYKKMQRLADEKEEMRENKK